MWRFVVLLVVLAPIVCNAETNVSGIRGNGEKITIVFDVYEKPILELSNKVRLLKTYKNVDCTRIEKDSSGNTATISCLNDEASPLSGTVYTGNRVKNSICENGDPDLIYTCTKGCINNHLAPKKLYQDFWEC